MSDVDEEEPLLTSGANVPHVYKGIHRVMTYFAHTGISKDRVNAEQKFKFRGIDDVMNALARQLVEAGILIIPRLKSAREVQNVNGKGTVVTSVFVEMDYVFRSLVDGSSDTASFPGEARDFADKATNKAVSAAYKYMALQTFCIPVEGDNDGDFASPTLEMPAETQASQSARGLRREGRAQPEQRDNPPAMGKGEGKSAARLKAEGVWEKIVEGMKVQRTEEELMAWASKNSTLLESLPPSWKEHARERFADRRAELRTSDRLLAERNVDRSFDPKTGELYKDDGDPNAPPF